MPATTMTPGQSVTLTANPTIAGNPGGTLPGPVTWTNNAMNNGQTVTMMPNGNTCTVTIPVGCSGGSFTVTATSGSLTANTILFVDAPAIADGMTITVGPVQ